MSAAPILLIDWAARAGVDPDSCRHAQRWSHDDRYFVVTLEADGRYRALRIDAISPRYRRSDGATGTTPERAVLAASGKPEPAADHYHLARARTRFARAVSQPERTVQ